jgi:hypothetical protein
LALAAIFGSLAGALTSSVSTWIRQRHEDRLDILAKRIFTAAVVFRLYQRNGDMPWLMSSVGCP